MKDRKKKFFIPLKTLKEIKIEQRKKFFLQS